MDKFDEYLKEKKTEEIKEFPIPESFQLVVEETLSNLPDNKKEKWYANKKKIAIAACFTFIFLLGSRFINPIDNNLNRMISNEADTARITSEKSMDQYESQSYNLEDIQNLIAEDEEIESLNIKSLKEGNRYKFVNKKEDISQVISLINSLAVTEVVDQEISDWDFLIQTNGDINHSIMIKDWVISVDLKWYKCDENISDKLNDLYNSFDYEEKDLAYCSY